MKNTSLTVLKFFFSFAAIPLVGLIAIAFMVQGRK